MTRRFGIELEHASELNHSALATELENAGVNVDHAATGVYQSRSYPGWQVKHDGSIRTLRTHQYAVELVSPPIAFNEHGKEEVKRALAVVAAHGKINRSCGFHVHVEARDLSDAQLRRLEDFFLSWKKVLLSYVPASRRNNHYCAPTTSRTHRYVALNLVPFNLRGTVEFRLHQGTLNAQKILAFVALCVNIVEFAKGQKEIPTIEIDPSTQNDSSVLTKVYKGQTFTVTKSAEGYVWEGREYPTLSAAATAIGKLFGRVRCSGPSFFGNPLTGNAMDALCREVALGTDDSTFLSRTYQRNTSTNGFFNE